MRHNFCQVNNLVPEVLILKQLKVPLKSTLMKKGGGVACYG
jgi:hypothetical protein